MRLFEDSSPTIWEGPTMEIRIRDGTLRIDPVAPGKTWRTVPLLVDGREGGLLLYRIEEEDSQQFLSVFHARYAEFDSPTHAYLRTRMSINGQMDERFLHLGRKRLERSGRSIAFTVSKSITVVFNWPAGKPWALLRQEAREMDRRCKSEYLAWYQQCRLGETKCPDPKTFLLECNARQRKKKYGRAALQPTRPGN